MSPLARTPLTIEHALLGFVLQQPMHGYEIHQRLRQAEGLGLVWQLKQSQLYALLGKLEESGYLTATLEPQEARPPRKVFRLTGAGREAFQTWVQAPVPQGRKLRMEFMAKLYFARRLGPEVVAGLVERQREVCQRWLDALRTQVEPIHSNRPFDRLVYQFRIGQIEAMLSWLDACAETGPPDATSFQ
ncbi:MAG: PadR family transcriptional regulator [Anaerolineae bacterium]